MRTVKVIIASVGLCVALIACNNKQTEDNTANERNNATTGTYRSDDVEDDFERTKSELERTWEQRMDEIDREIDELDARIESEKSESKEVWKQRKAELKDESRELRSRLDDIGDASEQNWESFKDEVEDDFKDLEASIENFFEKSDNDNNTDNQQ